jgi:hypothetical protein
MLAGLVVAATCLGLEAPPAQAVDGDIGLTTIRADVPVPDGASESRAIDARRELAERVAERIRTRLETARIKYYDVRVSDGTVVVKVGGDVGRRLAAGIAFPPGDAQIRPVLDVGAQWQKRLADVPDTVELRQGENLLDREDAHLWSTDRATLQSFLDDVSLEGAEAFVYAGDDGWRTMALGSPILSDADIRGSRIASVQNGTPYVALELSQSGSQRLERRSGADDRKWAVVVDGEIVAVMKRLTFSEGDLLISTPKHLPNDDAEMNWARQVAGRLAAPIPIPLAELDLD